MTFLLDVNVLFILHQPLHGDYRQVSRWFTAKSRGSFATCPMTQAGMLRLLTQSFQGLDRFTMQEARRVLRNLVQLPDHVFWPDEPPYLDVTAPLSKRMQGHRQITDAYLLGLANHHGGKLATLDKAIPGLAGPEFSHLVELVS
jgi:uncharacterized protein